MALHSGASPIFFNDLKVEELVPYPMQSLSTMSPDFRLNKTRLIDSHDLGITHVELGRAWDTMQAFCSLINFTAESGSKIPQQLFLDVMASVMYRLLSMEFPIDSLHEAVRLGLSAFCSHVFVQWSNCRPPKTSQFPTVYKACLAEHQNSGMASLLLMPWLLMVGAMAVFAEEDAWLDPWLRRATGMSDSGTSSPWSEVRATMKRYLWVDFVHDRCGAAICKSVHRHSLLDAGDKS